MIWDTPTKVKWTILLPEFKDTAAGHLVIDTVMLMVTKSFVNIELSTEMTLMNLTIKPEILCPSLLMRERHIKISCILQPFHPHRASCEHSQRLYIIRGTRNYVVYCVPNETWNLRGGIC